MIPLIPRIDMMSWISNNHHESLFLCFYNFSYFYLSFCETSFCCLEMGWSTCVEVVSTQQPQFSTCGCLVST